MRNETYDLPPYVAARQVGDETVIVDLEAGIYYGLDPVGAQVWELLGSRLSPDAICEALLREYEVSPSTLHDDVQSLVDDLVARKLIIRRPAARAE